LTGLGDWSVLEGEREKEANNDTIPSIDGEIIYQGFLTSRKNLMIKSLTSVQVRFWHQLN
jgi:hypothetical protein